MSGFPRARAIGAIFRGNERFSASPLRRITAVEKGLVFVE